SQAPAEGIPAFVLLSVVNCLVLIFCFLCWAGGFMRLAPNPSKDFTTQHAGIKKAPVNTGAFTLLKTSK
ncbi:MAG: hypothetical protein NT154_28660, partial [Verrucomicrobia bacterium]|nr:hypothetical protein [Verrucomicrobiota bacterium]